jgi:hypothetical protein
MTDEQHSKDDRRDDIEAEQTAWIEAVHRRDRDRKRLEDDYQKVQKQVAPRAEYPPIDQERAIADLLAHFRGLPKTRAKRRQSRLLNPDLAALDE